MIYHRHFTVLLSRHDFVLYFGFKKSNHLAIFKSRDEIDLDTFSKHEHEATAKEMRQELDMLRARLSGVDDLGSQSEDTIIKVKELETEIEEVLDKLWELDKSWKNNLVFYGVRSDSSDEAPHTTEAKVNVVNIGFGFI